MIERMDHIGIAVRDLEAVARFYTEALGIEASAPERVPSEGVTVVFLTKGECRIELLEPLDHSGPVKKFLEHRGEGVHHICFKVDDIQAAMRRLVTFGAQLIDEEPRAGRDGMRLAFVHPSSAHGVLLELLEVDDAQEDANGVEEVKRE